MQRYNVQLTRNQLEFIERSLEMLWIESYIDADSARRTTALIKKFEKAMEPKSSKCVKIDHSEAERIIAKSLSL